MSNIQAMIDAVAFIEANLQQDIAVADVADAVSYSLYHFCRMFNRVIHHTPYDYIIRRRLSESARELVQTDRRIIDIALDYQFNSPETYSRAFKRMFDVQPYQWRKQGSIDRRALLSRLTPAHIRHINKGTYLKPALEERDAFQVTGIMTLVQQDRGVIAQLWDMLAQELAGVWSAGETRCHYGIACYPQRWLERGYLYMAAVEAGALDVANPALVAKTVPPSKYARFIHKGPYRDLELTLDYIYQTWLPRSGQCLAGPFEIERHGPRCACPADEEAETEICIPIA